MNEPRRFLDDAGAPPDVRRLLAAAELPAIADPARLARSRRRVVGMAAIPVAGGGLLLLHKLAIAALLGSVVGVGVEVGRRTFAAAPAVAPARNVEPARGIAVRPAPAPTASEARTVPLAVSSSPAPARREGTAGSSAAAAPSASVGVARELELLEAARRVLESDPNRALAILEQHAREAPRGTLTIEREMLVIQTLVRSGRLEQAKVRAARFRAAHPESLYEERITRLLEQQGR